MTTTIAKTNWEKGERRRILKGSLRRGWRVQPRTRVPFTSEWRTDWWSQGSGPQVRPSNSMFIACSTPFDSGAGQRANLPQGILCQTT